MGQTATRNDFSVTGCSSAISIVTLPVSTQISSQDLIGKNLYIGISLNISIFPSMRRMIFIEMFKAFI